MKKNQKIKRYGNIYDKHGGLKKALAALGAAAVILLLALLGWILYTPVRDFFLDDGSGAPAPSSSVQESVSSPQESTAPTESSGSPAGTESSASESASSTPETPAPVVTLDGTRGVYLTAETALSPNVLRSAIDSAAAAGMNTVLVEAKNAAGTVLFTTSNSVAQEAKAVADRTYSAAETAKQIRDKGLTPAARVYAFRDPQASTVKRLAVTYGNSATRWLDNTAEQGGKSWLNPCLAEARQYIIDLSVELVKSGFDTILLDGVQFPSGVGLELAGYGVSGNFSRKTVLADFIDEITSAVEQAGGHVLVTIPAANLSTEENKSLQKTNRLLYGESPEALAGEKAVLLLPAGDSAKQLFALAKTLSPTTDWIALVPAYSADGTAVAANDALTAAGISKEYLLYNPQGTYVFP